MPEIVTDLEFVWIELSCPNCPAGRLVDTGFCGGPSSDPADIIHFHKCDTCGYQERLKTRYPGAFLVETQDVLHTPHDPPICIPLTDLKFPVFSQRNPRGDR